MGGTVLPVREAPRCVQSRAAIRSHTHCCESGLLMLTASDVNNAAFYSLFSLIINLPKHPHHPNVYFPSLPSTGSLKATEDSGRAYMERKEGRNRPGCKGGITEEATERDRDPIEPFLSSALSAPPQKKRDETAEQSTGSLQSYLTPVC